MPTLSYEEEEMEREPGIWGTALHLSLSDTSAAGEGLSQVERHEQTGVQISLEGDRSRLNIKSHSHTHANSWLILIHIFF